MHLKHNTVNPVYFNLRKVDTWQVHGRWICFCESERGRWTGRWGTQTLTSYFSFSCKTNKSQAVRVTPGNKTPERSRAGASCRSWSIETTGGAQTGLPCPHTRGSSPQPLWTHKPRTFFTVPFKGLGWVSLDTGEIPTLLLIQGETERGWGIRGTGKPAWTTQSRKKPPHEQNGGGPGLRCSAEPAPAHQLH